MDSFLSLENSYEDSKYVLIRFPFEVSSSWVPGSKLGPDRVIEASKYLDTFDLELKSIPAEAGIHTLPEVEVGTSVERALSSLERIVDKVLDDGKIPIVLGGEHTISIGAARAAKRHGASIFITLDAHMDFYDEYEGNKFSHACTSRRVSEFMKVAVIGVRTADWEEYENSRNSIVVFRDELDKWSSKLSALKGLKAHLSVDLDVLDPSVLPCLGTPEPDGLSWSEAREIIRDIVREFKVISMDFVEFRPCDNMVADSLAVAKLIYKTIAYHITNYGNQLLR